LAALGIKALRAYKEPATLVQKPSEDAISCVLVQDARLMALSAAIGTYHGFRDRRGEQ